MRNFTRIAFAIAMVGLLASCSDLDYATAYNQAIEMKDEMTIGQRILITGGDCSYEFIVIGETLPYGTVVKKLRLKTAETPTISLMEK